MEQEQLKQDIKTYLSAPLNPELPPFDRGMLQKIAEWLMAYAPGRYRMFVRQMLSAPMPFRVQYANGQLTSILRRLEEYGSVEQVEQNIGKIIEAGFKAVDNADALVRRVANDKPDVSPISKRVGKRDDHDQLPESIRACYEENLPLIQQIRSKHEKMKIYYRQLKDQRGSSAAAPCDIEETVHMLKTAAKEIMDLNDRRLANWQRYDEYRLRETPTEQQATEPGKALDADATRKLISTNVSYISRYTGRLFDLSTEADERVKFVSLKEEMQNRVNELLAAGWTWPETSKHRPILEKCGIKC